MKIAFYTNMPSPYRVDFFNELGKYCDLYVFFEKENGKTRDKSWKEKNFVNFKAIFLKGINYSIDSSLCFNVVNEYKKIKPDINIIGNVSLTYVLLSNYFIKNKINYYIEGDGGFPHKCNKIKKQIKDKIYSNALNVFYTSNTHKDYCLQYTNDESKLIKYPFTSIRQKDILAEFDLNKSLLKEELHLNDVPTFISVGRFLDWKNFELTIEAFKKIDNKSQLLIIGGTPTKSYLRLISEKNIKNITFMPFMKKEVLFKYMKASDCFVFSSNADIWGLVINEAAACGLPIISSSTTLSATELGKDNKGIMIFESKSLDQLENYYINFLNLSNQEKKEMALSNIEKSHQYTIEKMVDFHVDYFHLK